MAPCTHRIDARSPVACSSGTDSNLWRVASWVLKSTHLSAQLEHPFHGNSHKSCGLAGCPCQLSTTWWSIQPGLPKSQTTNHKKDGSWRPMGSPWSPRMARIRVEKGQGSCCSNGSTCLHAVTLTWAKTALIKHKIEITDWMPFKEHYQHIPSHMYNDMKAHIQEMLDIGAICKSHSPWASTVGLVQKKDGSLRFCIDLRKLNNWTVKDAYSLPHIDETLDSLQGSQWFSSLNMKLGYWQVKMDEENKPLTAFTVGPLGFYECERMPFGLTNIRLHSRG